MDSNCSVCLCLLVVGDNESFQKDNQIQKHKALSFLYILAL